MTATLSKPVSSFEIYKQQIARGQISSKCDYIEATAGLLVDAIDKISCRIEQEISKARKEDRKLTDFEEEMWNWEGTFKHIRLALRGIENESDEIDTKLSYIMHFINDKTGMILNYKTHTED